MPNGGNLVHAASGQIANVDGQVPCEGAEGISVDGPQPLWFNYASQPGFAQGDYNLARCGIEDGRFECLAGGRDVWSLCNGVLYIGQSVPARCIRVELEVVTED